MKRCRTVGSFNPDCVAAGKARVGARVEAVVAATVAAIVVTAGLASTVGVAAGAGESQVAVGVALQPSKTPVSINRTRR